MLKFHNAKNFRNILVFSLLSGKNVTLTRSEPFQSFELNFLEFLQLITKGSKVFVINKNRQIDFKPGSIEQDHYDYIPEFDCQQTRSISYYLEPIFILGLFCRDHLSVTLKGITNDNIDFSVDVLKNSLIPFLHSLFDDKKHYDL